MGDNHMELSERDALSLNIENQNSGNDEESGGDETDNGTATEAPRFGHHRYATRKTAAQGMMDVALLVANASQLKSVVDAGPSHKYYIILMMAIIVSLLLQITTGILLLFVGSRESKSKDEDDVDHRTNLLNNITIAIIFIIIVVNVFIAAFGIGDTTHLLPSA